MSNQEIQAFRSDVDVNSVDNTDVNSVYKSSLSALQVVKILHFPTNGEQEHGMGFAPAFYAYKDDGAGHWQYFNLGDVTGQSFLNVDDTTVYNYDSSEMYVFILKEPLDE